MSDVETAAQEADDRGRDHDLRTADPVGVIGTDGRRYRMTAIEYFARSEHPEIFIDRLEDLGEPVDGVGVDSFGCYGDHRDDLF